MSAPTLSDNALAVLRQRYLKRDKSGAATEEPADMFRRVATAIARVDATYGADAQQAARTEEIRRISEVKEDLPLKSQQRA